MPLTIDRGNVQALVLESYRCPHSLHFLYRIPDAAQGRRFLARWLPRITHGGQDTATGPGPFINLALTWQGLVALDAFDDLGGAEEAAKAFPWDFREPPEAVSLGDFGESAPSKWWNGRFGGEAVHLTVHAHFRTPDARDSLKTEMRRAASEHGLKELVPTRDGADPLQGDTLDVRNGRELHFGYQDGFSQPEVNWQDEPNRPDLVDPRHFLLGYWTDAIQAFPKDPPWSDVIRDGSYLVFRWLYQDVAGFNAYLAENARHVARPGMSVEQAEELLAAKMMGRWRDGTPLVLSPDRQDPARAVENFGYAYDPEGHQCPFAAHVRIVNPRDQTLTNPNRIMCPDGPPRVLRRGHSYGPKLTGTRDDGVDRGIIGMFLCSNINRQFYTLTRWIRQTTFSPVFKDTRAQDPLFGNRRAPLASDSFEIPGSAGTTLRGLPDFVRTQGTLMLLLPSVAMLERLAVAH